MVLIFQRIRRNKCICLHPYSWLLCTDFCHMVFLSPPLYPRTFMSDDIDMDGKLLQPTSTAQILTLYPFSYPLEQLVHILVYSVLQKLILNSVLIWHCQFNNSQLLDFFNNILRSGLVPLTGTGCCQFRLTDWLIRISLLPHFAVPQKGKDVHWLSPERNSPHIKKTQ